LEGRHAQGNFNPGCAYTVKILKQWTDLYFEIRTQVKDKKRGDKLFQMLDKFGKSIF